METLKAFLEDIGYTGFANFDVKYDSRDGSYRVFEINLRQGRSNYYVTGAGYNLARYVVEDRVLNKDLGPCVMNQKETFWHSVPRAVVYKYVKPRLRGQSASARPEGRETTSFGYRPDLLTNPKRMALLSGAHAALFQEVQNLLQVRRDVYASKDAGHSGRAGPHGHGLFLRTCDPPHQGRLRPGPHRHHHQQPGHHPGPHARFILGQSQDDPFDIMAADAARLVTFGAEMLAIPCNTAHYFYDRLNQTIPVPHFEHGGRDGAHRQNSAATRWASLPPAAPLKRAPISASAKRRGSPVKYPAPPTSKKIMDIIYKDIKQGKPADMQAFCEVSDHLRSAGCGRIILGCTELSLIKRDEHLDSFYIDSMEVLAKHAILAFGKTPIGFEED